MCLFVKETRDDFRRRLLKDRKITVYKVMGVVGSNQYGIHTLKTPYRGVIVKPGVTLYSSELYDKSLRMLHGECVHVFSTLKTARENRDGGEIILKLRVPVLDVVAIGSRDEIGLDKLQIPKDVENYVVK